MCGGTKSKTNAASTRTSMRSRFSSLPPFKKKQPALFSKNPPNDEEEVSNDVDAETRGRSSKSTGEDNESAPVAAAADDDASPEDQRDASSLKANGEGPSPLSRDSPSAGRTVHRRRSSLLALLGSSSQNPSSRLPVPTPSSLRRLVNQSDWDEIRDILVKTPDEKPPPSPKRKPGRSRRRRASTFGRRRSSMSSFSDEEDEDQEGQDGVRRPYVDLPKLIEECTDFTGQTILHDVLRCHPPLDVVTLLVELYPRSLLDVNFVGHSLLHVAAGWGASPQIVEYLADLNGRMAGKGDCRGKTPLHLMCEHLTCGDGREGGTTTIKGMRRRCSTGKRPRVVARSDTGEVDAAGEIKLVEGPTLGAVTALLEARPDSAVALDKDGMTPIDYAIRGNAPREILDALQGSAERQGRSADTASFTREETPPLSSSDEEEEGGIDDDDDDSRRDRRAARWREGNLRANVDDAIDEVVAERIVNVTGASPDLVRSELTNARTGRILRRRCQRRWSTGGVPREIVVPHSVGEGAEERRTEENPPPPLPDSIESDASGFDGDDDVGNS